MVTATGCRISLPGSSAPISSGTRAMPAASAVISTGVRRSSVPRITSCAPEALALEQRQVDVVADLEDAVARGDAGERDEADGAGDRERLAGDPQRRDAADQRQRHVAHDDERQHRSSGSACTARRRSAAATRPTATRSGARLPPAPGTVPRGWRSSPAGTSSRRSPRGCRRRCAPCPSRRCWRTRRCAAGRSRAGSDWGRRSRSRRRWRSSGMRPAGLSISISPSARVLRSASLRRTTTSKRFDWSMICETTLPFESVSSASVTWLGLSP